jgi:Ca2+-binding RTX toxin-like protein
MKRFLMAIASLVLVLGVVGPIAPAHAQVNTLDVNGPPNTPNGEQQANAQGGQATLTASVTDLGVGVPQVNVDFEIESGPNDGGSRDGGGSGIAFPVDFTCTTGADGTCVVHYPDDPNNNPAANVDQIRSWIDSDDSDSTIEANGEGANEASDPDPGDPEPNGTDVVLIRWDPPAATRLDVEPDAVAAQRGANKQLTANVTSSSGQGIAGKDVDYRIGNNAPVFGCTTAADGTCAIPMPSPGSDTTQSPRFWIDESGDQLPDEADLNEGRNEQTTPGDTAEPDVTDVTSIQWVTLITALDVTPEESSGKDGDALPLQASVTDANNAPKADQPVIFLVATGPDKGTRAFCQTDASGTCSSTLTGTDVGEDVVMGWVDTNHNGFADEADGSEGKNDGEFNDPGGKLEPDGTDVVSMTFTGVCPGHHDDARNQVIGTQDNEVLVGTTGDDVICGLGGSDTLKGKGGNDLLIGGIGNDTLNGGGGNDVLKGNEGNDKLSGNDGNDRLFGQQGNDNLNGGKATDHCRQGNGTGKRVACET